eukprot:6200259-Pleurochrysis_carterae.AAC.4
MKAYMCGELRKMAMGFLALSSAEPSFKLLSAQQVVQLDYYAPSARTLADSSACTTGRRPR